MSKSSLEVMIMKYYQINKGKYKTVKHFESEKSIKPFTSLINISEDRGYAKSNPDFWLKIHDGKKWGKLALSGLFKTEHEHFYWGDIKRKGVKTNTFILRFGNNQEMLTIFLFNHHTSEIDKLVSYIQ